MTIQFIKKYITLYELFSGYFLSSQQLNTISDLYKSINDEKHTHVYQIIMGGGKTTVIIPLTVMILLNDHKDVLIVQPIHLVNQTFTIFKKCLMLLLPNKTCTVLNDNNFKQMIVNNIYDIKILNDSVIKQIKLHDIDISASAVIYDEIDDLANNLKSEYEYH